jgi:hypothetical protein
MPLIIDDTNWKTQVGNGKYVDLGGERFYLSAEPKPAGHNSGLYSKPLRAARRVIPRTEWDARIEELAAKKMRISDHQRWACDAQSGPTCWAAGTCQAYSTKRVMQMGMEHYVRISARSLAVPINGGRSGGYEGNAVRYLTEHGGVDSRLWGYGAMSPSASAAEVAANRLLHKSLESEECDGFDEFATAMLDGDPCTVSYNWWSHVVMLVELVKIESGSYGFKIRNNWGEGYGDKGEYGFGGYAIFREGKGTPGGGFAFRSVTPSKDGGGT